MEITQKFNEIGLKDIQDFITKQLTSASRDMGSKLTDDDCNYIVDSISKTITFKYQNWSLFNFKCCIDNGKLGNYTSFGSQKLTVVNIEKWMMNHNQVVQAEIIQGQIELQAQRRNETFQMFEKNKNPEIAMAVLSRLNKICYLSKKYVSDFTVIPSLYLKEKERISNIPLSVLVDAVKDGTIDSVLKTKI